MIEKPPDHIIVPHPSGVHIEKRPCFVCRSNADKGCFILRFRGMLNAEISVCRNCFRRALHEMDHDRDFVMLFQTDVRGPGLLGI
jgi:hypothetical protein